VTATSHFFATLYSQYKITCLRKCSDVRLIRKSDKCRPQVLAQVDDVVAFMISCLREISSISGLCLLRGQSLINEGTADCPTASSVCSTVPRPARTSAFFMELGYATFRIADEDQRSAKAGLCQSKTVHCTWWSPWSAQSLLSPGQRLCRSGYATSIAITPADACKACSIFQTSQNVFNSAAQTL